MTGERLRSDSQNALESALSERILIMDGAMGTMLQAYNPTIDDFLGLENCSEILNRSHPEWIEAIHRRNGLRRCIY